jgi:hypothetical protein
MAYISIDQIDFSLPGVTAQRSEGIARKIADGLAASAGSLTIPATVPLLDINLVGTLDESDEALARRIVAEIVLQLDRIA